jgi:hypothetical protein
MRMRADQVREGHRLRGAVVTRVRSAVDAGVVRISVHNDTRGDSSIAPGTFCYRADDILDVDMAAKPRPFTSAKQRAGRRTRPDGSPVRAYRVEYQAAAGDGYLIVRSDGSSTPSLVVRAHDLLQTQGIDARIRRIVPVDRGYVTQAAQAQP